MPSPIIGCNTLYAPDAPLNHSVQATKIALDHILACGYAAVEYSHCGSWTVEQAQDIVHHSQSLGLQNWSCHAPFFPKEESYGDSHYVAGLVHTLELSAVLGARVNVVHVPFHLGLLKPDEKIDYADYREQDLRILKTVLPRARDLGIALALENSHTRKHMAYILSLVAQIADPLIGICVDTGHAALGDLDPAFAIRQSGDLLLTTHLQDNNGTLDDHLPPGAGTIDWRDVTSALQQVAYQGALMLELTDNAHERPYDQAQEQRAGYAYIAGLWSARQ